MPAPSYPLGHKLESAHALTAPQTLNMALELGIKLVLAGGELSAIGDRNAITELAPHIRACKPELVRLLCVEAANDPGNDPSNSTPAPDQHGANTVPAPEQPDWRALDAAYLTHHAHCHVCQAAGRGTRYGLRCGVGASLWSDYTAAITQPGALPWQQPKGQRHD